LGSIERRLYLLGRVVLEAPAGILAAEDLPGRQGRLALVFLALRRSQPVPRGELAESLWSQGPPEAWDVALSAVVSKLRRGLTTVGLEGALVSGGGCYELRLPTTVWVDIETAATQLDRAEGALRREEVEAAWAAATVALAILRRPLLPGDDAPWLTVERARLDGMRARASDGLVASWLARGEGALAQRLAEEAVAQAPLREENHRLLMRAHLLQGNRSEALLAYHRCQRRLLDELGVAPSPTTQRVHRLALDQPDRVAT
jgi:SARP family transcriptional regulator, regulator of embCAB operon